MAYKFFQDLRDEEILNIFSFFTTPELVNLPSVSTQFQRLSKDNRSWFAKLTNRYDVWVEQTPENALELFIIHYLYEKGMATALKAGELEIRGQNDHHPAADNRYFKMVWDRLTTISSNCGIKEFLMGKLYYYGCGVRQEIDTGIEYFIIAEKKGNVNAGLMLTKIAFREVEGCGFRKLKLLQRPEINIKEIITKTNNFLQKRKNTNPKMAYESAVLEIARDLALIDVAKNKKLQEQFLEAAIDNELKNFSQRTLFLISTSINYSRLSQPPAKIKKTYEICKTKERQPWLDLKLIENLEHAMQLGSVEATLYLAYLYLDGNAFDYQNFKRVSLERVIIFPKYHTAIDGILNISEAHLTKAIGCLETAANLGSNEAIYQLGCVYAFADIISHELIMDSLTWTPKPKFVFDTNINKAIGYFGQGIKMAKDEFSVACAMALVRIYGRPEYNLLSRERVLHYYDVGAKLGKAECLVSKGRLFLEGYENLGIAIDLDSAEKQFELAFVQSNKMAEVISNCYLDAPKLEKQVKWMVRGVLSGQSECANGLKEILIHSRFKEIAAKWGKIQTELKQNAAGNLSLMEETRQKIIALANQSYEALELDIKDEFLDNLSLRFVLQNHRIL